MLTQKCQEAEEQIVDTIAEMELAEVIARVHTWLEERDNAPGVCPVQYEWAFGMVWVDGQGFGVAQWLREFPAVKFVHAAPDAFCEVVNRIAEDVRFNALDEQEFGELFYRVFYAHAVK